MTSAEPTRSTETACYEEIESAVCETARGRWFLEEYARRVRADDTARILSALGRIEALLQKHKPEAEHARPLNPLEMLTQRLNDALAHPYDAPRTDLAQQEIADEPAPDRARHII